MKVHGDISGPETQKGVSPGLYLR